MLPINDQSKATRYKFSHEVPSEHLFDGRLHPSGIIELIHPLSGRCLWDTMDIAVVYDDEHGKVDQIVQYEGQNANHILFKAAIMLGVDVFHENELGYHTPFAERGTVKGLHQHVAVSNVNALMLSEESVWNNCPGLHKVPMFFDGRFVNSRRTDVRDDRAKRLLDSYKSFLRSYIHQPDCRWLGVCETLAIARRLCPSDFESFVDEAGIERELASELLQVLACFGAVPATESHAQALEDLERARRKIEEMVEARFGPVEVYFASRKELHQFRIAA